MSVGRRPSGLFLWPAIGVFVSACHGRTLAPALPPPVPARPSASWRVLGPLQVLNVSLRSDESVYRPGDTAQLTLSYVIVTPESGDRVPVVERWLVTFRGAMLGTPVVKPIEYKPPGSHASTFRFQVTRDFIAGAYTVLAVVRVLHEENSAEAVIHIRP